MVRGRIRTVRVFAADLAAVAAMREHGAAVVRNPPKRLFEEADRGLRLGGRLVAYVAERQFEVEPAPATTDEQWRNYLDGQYRGLIWQRWYGKTRTAVYSVVVVYEPAHTAGQSQSHDDSGAGDASRSEERDHKRVSGEAADVDQEDVAWALVHMSPYVTPWPEGMLGGCLIVLAILGVVVAVTLFGLRIPSWLWR